MTDYILNYPIAYHIEKKDFLFLLA